MPARFEREWHVRDNYIWAYSAWAAGEAVGVKFGGASQPCVAAGRRVSRGIYYFRNVIPNYGYFIDLYLDADCNQDGCPTLSSVLR